MKTTLKSLILTTLALGVMLVACESPAKRIERARTLYNEGTELRQQRLSEEAAERFLQALTLMQGCEPTTENIRLEGQLKDNLGAMYNKHGLFDDALKMHTEAIACFRQVDDSAAVMTTMRNCGRVANSMEQFAQAKRYYDTAFSIATLLDDRAMQSDIYLEMGRDYYLPVGNFPEAMNCVRHALEGELDDNNTDIANMTMGVLYYYTDNYAEAKPYLNAALRSERAGVKMAVYQTFYAIAYNEGDLVKAMEYQDLFTQNMMQSDQNRIHELVSDMENLIRTNDDLRRDRQTLSQRELLMTNKIMGRNKVYTTAQSLSEQVTSDTMNFDLSDDDWADFISLTDLDYDGFSQRLLELYPKLGKWDVRICCLSKNGFSNQVISILLDTQTESYYKRKTRIKQMKMDLSEDNRTFEEIVNAV